MAGRNKNIQLKGLKELLKSLEELPERIEKKVVSAAVRSATNVIMQEAKRRAPRGQSTGKRTPLKEGFTIRKNTKAPKGVTEFYTGVKTRKHGGANHAHLVEFGTSAHIIGVRPNKRFKSLRKGRTEPAGALGHKSLAFWIGKIAKHPGATARPYMRPAFDAKHKAAIEKMKERLGVGIGREVKKLQAENRNVR